MKTVVQISPEFGEGSGVGSVASNLEREWQRLGLRTERFTMADARGGWLPEPCGGVRGKVVLMARVMWFSTVGTVLARRALRSRPDLVSVCHNDAVVGDVYVNHGNVHAAMKRRGSRWWRTLRNPLHVFTGLRDTYRYSSPRVHRAVVNLVETDAADLASTYPRIVPTTAIIGNGVDTQRFMPPTDEERTEWRAVLGLAPDDFAILFVGHEYDRKGLPAVLDAMRGSPAHWHLVVVGGTNHMVQRLRASAVGSSLGSRLHTPGAVADPRPYFHASDVLAFPSYYESYGLVVVEALACGLPVVATPTGCVPDVVQHGINGLVLDPDARGLRSAMSRVDETDRAGMRRAARQTALENTWESVAIDYLRLFDRVSPVPGGWAPQ